MNIIKIKGRLKAATLLLTLLIVLFALQFSVLPPVSAQGGDKDGGEAGYTEQPEAGSGPETGVGLSPGDANLSQDEWSDEESGATQHEAGPGELQQVVTPTLQLNTGHATYYDEQTGQWIDDPTVTAFSAANVLAAEQRVQQYYQEKLKGLDPTSLTFRSGVTLSLQPGIASTVFQQLAGAQAGEGSYLLIQFSYPFPPEARQRLEAAGVILHDHVGPTGFYAWTPGPAIALLQALVAEGLIRHVGPIPLEAKIEPDLLQAAAASGAEQAVVVLTFEEPSPVQLQELQNLLLIERRSDGPIHILEGKIAGASGLALAGLNYVRWVERQPDNILFNLDGGMAIGGDVVRQNLQDGTDVNVMVIDTGIARSGTTYHPDLQAGRIVDQWDYQSSDSVANDAHSHGTHVAGTIGGRYNSGDANSNRSHQGMAPDVDYYIYKLCCGAGQFSSSWFQSALQRGTSGGRTTHISNNSWGISVGGTYNINSEIADRAVRGEYNGLPINMIMAAGNDDHAVAAPATGKNVISVGSVKDGNYPDQLFTNACGGDRNWPPGQQVCYSNHGPIDVDGDTRTRVKPDLVAPGAMIFSAAPWYLYGDSRYYQFNHGTSMATPHVSGAVAQLLDAYSASAPWLWSWPETVKALLLATAIDIGGNTSLYGRGLINPFHALYTQSNISSANFWGNSINGGEIKEFTFSVPSGYRELRIVLTWSDPAGSTELSHDLDIIEVLDGGNVSRGGSSSFDDTVEYVTIPAGFTPGTWKIRVHGFSVSSTQRFGLAVHRVLANPNINLNPSVEYIPVSAPSVVPGDYFYLHQYISNAGFAVSGSYARLNVPAGFNVAGVRIYTADGHSHFYDASEIYHPTGSSFWRVALGEEIAGYTRHARWFIQVDPTTAFGNYNFFSQPYWMSRGALQNGTERTSVVTVGPSGPPIDVYLIADLSGSFADDLPEFKAEAPAIISAIKAAYPNTRFGLARFEDYPIPPFGSAPDGDKAYQRLIDLTFDTSAVLSAISGLSTRYGGDAPESQLAALYQAATGAGQNLAGVGFPGASIAAGQQASFRAAAAKLILLWTDDTFHQPGDPGTIPYPGPSFDQTIKAVKALGKAKVIAIYSAPITGTSTESLNNQGEIESLATSSGLRDVRRITRATGGLAPLQGVDCDNNGVIDIPAGQPLVCGVGSAGEGIGEAAVAVIKAAIKEAVYTVQLPTILK